MKNFFNNHPILMAIILFTFAIVCCAMMVIGCITKHFCIFLPSAIISAIFIIILLIFALRAVIKNDYYIED